MTCKKKQHISVITAPCANYPPAGPSCKRHTQVPWSGSFSAPKLELPAADTSRGLMKRGRAFPPLAALLIA